MRHGVGPRGLKAQPVEEKGWMMRGFGRKDDSCTVEVGQLSLDEEAAY